MPSRSEGLGLFRVLLDDQEPSPGLAEQRARCESELRDEVCAAVVKIAEHATQNVLVALRQLAAGMYGYCVDCHEKIRADRLDALSLAVRCTDCERARESSAIDKKTRPSRFAGRLH